MNEEIIPLEHHAHYKYLGALYRLGLHDTMRMMKYGEFAHTICSRYGHYYLRLF